MPKIAQKTPQKWSLIPYLMTSILIAASTQCHDRKYLFLRYFPFLWQKIRLGNYHFQEIKQKMK